MNKIDKILLSLAISMAAFVIAVFFVFVKTGGSEPSVLVTVVGGAIITEIIALCKIKCAKEKGKNGENQPK